jgi:signal transduction histidine kinase
VQSSSIPFEALNAESGVRLLQAVALAIGEAEDLRHALAYVLAEVGRATGWVTGESWLPDAAGECLTAGPSWTDPREALESFHAASAEFAFRRGEGLVGRVWETGRSEWVQDITRDPSFLRAQQAADVGLRTAAAIPVLARREVVAVLVFYHFRERGEDRQRLDLVSAVASQLGMLVQRKRAEDDLARKAEELARANAELEQLVWLASHDLQEPMRMVTIYSQMLDQRCNGRLGAEEREILDFVNEGAARMQVLLNDLRVYAEITRRPLAVAAVAAGAVVDRALVALKPAIEATGGEIHVGPLPVVDANAAELTQVFEQLIHNALTHRPKGDVPRVNVTAEEEQVGWVFAIRDNGIGIAPGFVERIFGVFQRLNGRDARSGSGIGLPICRKIIERHGGRIWVESTPGEGSTFRFSLPRTGSMRGSEKRPHPTQ